MNAPQLTARIEGCQPWALLLRLKDLFHTEPRMNKEYLLDRLYQSEIGFSIVAFYDRGFDWKLGDALNGFKAEGNARDFSTAVIDLCSAAVQHFPQSTFAQWMRAQA